MSNQMHLPGWVLAAMALPAVNALPGVAGLGRHAVPAVLAP